MWIVFNRDGRLAHFIGSDPRKAPRDSGWEGFNATTDGILARFSTPVGSWDAQIRASLSKTTNNLANHLMLLNQNLSSSSERQSNSPLHRFGKLWSFMDFRFLVGSANWQSDWLYILKHLNKEQQNLFLLLWQFAMKMNWKRRKWSKAKMKYDYELELRPIKIPILAVSYTHLTLPTIYSV